MKRTGYQRAVSLSLVSLVPRGFAITASGLVHATIFASLVYTGQGHAAAPVESLISVDTLEELEQARPVEPPDPPRADVLPTHETHHHPYPVPRSHDTRPHEPSLAHAAASHAEAVVINAPPAAVTASPEGPARFTIVVPPLAGNAAGGGAVTGSGRAGAENGSPAMEPTYAESAISARARVLSSAPASYPSGARASGEEADVPVEIVVDTAGHVVDARVVSPVGFGFDESALSAIRRYRFSPAQREGQPVRVRMRWSVQFRLR